MVRLFNERLEDIQIGLAQDRRILGFINQRVQELKFMTDYYPEDRLIRDEALAGLAARRNPMVKEKQCYAVDQMRDVLLGCAELKGIDIASVAKKHLELEKYYEQAMAERNR